MARYIIKQMPRLNGQEEGVTYPKMVIDGTMTEEDIARKIAEATTFSEGEVLAVIHDLSRRIAQGIADGHSVRIAGLGAFAASLGFRRGVEREQADGSSRRNAASIELRGATFRPDRSFVSRARAQCSLVRQPYRAPGEVAVPEAERLGLALEHLQTHPTLTIGDYVALTHLSRTAASLELRRLEDEGKLLASGRGTHRVYVLPRS